MFFENRLRLDGLAKWMGSFSRAQFRWDYMENVPKAPEIGHSPQRGVRPNRCANERPNIRELWGDLRLKQFRDISRGWL